MFVQTNYLMRIKSLLLAVLALALAACNSAPSGSLPHLWEKFYKVDKARTRAYGGSGVGLSIVRAIMNLLHQEYGVINYDNGVKFWFELDTSGADPRPDESNTPENEV